MPMATTMTTSMSMTWIIIYSLILFILVIRLSLMARSSVVVFTSFRLGNSVRVLVRLVFTSRKLKMKTAAELELVCTSSWGQNTSTLERTISDTLLIQTDINHSITMSKTKSKSKRSVTMSMTMSQRQLLQCQCHSIASRWAAYMKHK